MNSKKHIHCLRNRWPQWLNGMIICGLAGWLLAQPAGAAQDTWRNDGIITYPGTEMAPPMIQATNVINTGTFDITFTAPYQTFITFFETSDTLNYTNTGTMRADPSFLFDHYSTADGSRTPADNFFNSGTVRCGYFYGLTDIINGTVNNYYSLGEYPQCWISASNIISPGALAASSYGLVQLHGRNVDLSHGSLSVQKPVGMITVGSMYGGLLDWMPGFDLTPTSARSAWPALTLNNSTPYFDISQTDVNNVLIRAVFLQDTSNPYLTNSSVACNVYLNRAAVGRGAVVEWAGSYLDIATGNFLTNYLYLYDDASLLDTNVIFAGTWGNFNFYQQPQSLNLGLPTAPGFVNVFDTNVVTGDFSYITARFLPTSVGTNAIVNQALTNLPGRIEIAATNELNMSRIQIAGPNYLSVQSPRQFDGSPGAKIQSPFSDLNVGVTNGFLTVSNLLVPRIPNWLGTCQAWTMRWAVTNGVIYTFQVWIVGSQLNPITLAQVQDLWLHGTNSLVISDSFHVMRTVYSDAQNLTLTTNGLGVGADSLNGGIQMQNTSIFWDTSMPNLRNLTNFGEINTMNLAKFNNVSNVFSTTPGVSAESATGRLGKLATGNVANGARVVLGNNLYIFTNNTVNNAVFGWVRIGSSLDNSLNNLIAAINGAAGAGTSYSTSTIANPQARAGALVTTGAVTNQGFVVTALTAGAAGNSLQLATTSPNLTCFGAVLNTSSTTLTGGMDAVAGTTNLVSTARQPYYNFVNYGLMDVQGSILWANNFENYGVFSNGINSFNLTGVTATMTNGLLAADGDIIFTNSSLVISNSYIRAGRGLTLQVTNLLTDCGITNGNYWSVQNPSTNNPGGLGLNLTLKPALGDLLGTSITNYAAAPNRLVVNYWAGEDRGLSVRGYTNNVAVGRLILDAGTNASLFEFDGTGSRNAIYVDRLELVNAMTNGINSSFDFKNNLTIGTNMMIYFADAVANGVSIAEKIDTASRAGRNSGGRLRWVPAYVGYFSTTNIVYPDGTTNAINSGLAAATTIDSDGDGIPNATDPTPVFVTSQVGLRVAVTNAPALAAAIQWASIPGATNYVYYSTNLAIPGWRVLTNFVSPATTPPVGGWPLTNLVVDPVAPAQAKFYNVEIIPNSALLFGQ